METTLELPVSEFVAIQINLNVARSVKDSMRFEKGAFDALVSEMEIAMGCSTASKKVEVRIINIDGSIKDITFEELKPQVTY